MRFSDITVALMAIALSATPVFSRFEGDVSNPYSIIPANDSVDSSYGSEAPPPSYEISTFNSIDDIYSIISAGPELDSSSYITLNPALFPDTTQTQDAIFTPGPSGIDIVPIYTDNAAIESFLSQAKGSYTYPAESYISQVGESYTYSAESYTSKEAGSYAYPTGTISSMDYNNTYAVSSFVTATAMPTIHGNHTRNLTVSSTTSDFPSPTAITNTGCFNSPFIAGLVSVIAIGMVAIAL